MDEMEIMIAKYGLKSLYFADETFLTSKKWGREICRGIIERGINKKISWMVQTNVRTFDEETAKFMSDSGCIMVLFGAESGCDAILRDVYKKPQTKKQIIDAFKIAQKYNMITEASLIVGCVEETQSNLDETVDLVRQIKADFLDVHYLTPTPGSALYDSYSI